MPEEDRQRFLSPVYDEANDTRTDESVRMLMFLASGEADALTERHMNRSDSPNELLKRTDEIIRDDLFGDPKVSINKLQLCRIKVGPD